MKPSYFSILLLAAFFLSCENTPEYDKGPCKFAPPESNFPIIPMTCEECYFNLTFQGKDYSFPGNKLSSPFGGDWSQMTNVFLSFYLIPPDSDEELYNSIDVKTPLLKMETITQLNDSPLLVSTAFGIYNYCKVFFQPVTDDISQSYHQLTEVDLIESYPTEINSEPFQLFSFYLTGELHATIIIDGEAQVATAEYKVKSSVYEKL